MITCKSPLKMIVAAHALGRQLFGDRRHKCGRHDFTRPQLFACLVLREHQRKSYRGAEALLADAPNLREAIGMDKTPDHNTLCRAFRDLVKGRSMNRALDVQVAQAQAAGLDVAGGAAKPSAMDSTCFESHHVSRHFAKRREQTAAAAAEPVKTAPERPGEDPKRKPTAADLRRSKTIRGLPKLSLAVACSCHLILAARATVGLGSDHPHFAPLLADAGARADVRVVAADAGYDSEANHEAGRDGAGVRTLIPPLIGRPSDKEPAGRYRAMMKRQLKRRDVRATYGQRWQVETVNSMVKRNLGSALRARTPHRRSMELLLRSVVHNVMVLEGTED